MTRRAPRWAVWRRSRSPGADRALLVVAGVAFVAAFAFGLRALPAGEVDLRWWPFVVLVVLAVPATSAANALEYVVTARIDGQRARFGDAFEIAVLSSAANLLPLPGAALVRIRALRRGGSSGRRAVSVTAVVGGAWLAVSLVAAGIALVLARPPDVDDTVVAVVCTGGLVGLSAALVAVRAVAPRGRAGRLGAALVAAELLAVAVGALRYLLVLHGLHLGAGVAQAVSLTVAGPLASAVGFVPGGLGIREALAGLIAGPVGLAGTVGVLATAVDRLAGLPVLAVLAAGFALRRPAETTSS